MSSEANKICCIIVFEGFPVNGQYLVREFGYIEIDENASPNSFRFDLRPFKKRLRPEQWELIKYVTEKISGLPFLPAEDMDEETVSLDLLETKVLAVYNLHKSAGKDTVAYIGGHAERDVLKRLKIPSVNLRDLNCPIYEDVNVAAGLDTCGFHVQDDTHCPLAKLFTFRDWVLDRKLEEKVARSSKLIEKIEIV